MLLRGGNLIWGDPAAKKKNESEAALAFTMHLEDKEMGAEEAIAFLMEHAANESLAIDGRMLSFRDWFIYMYTDGWMDVYTSVCMYVCM
jgi:hypothetical protein